MQREIRITAVACALFLGARTAEAQDLNGNGVEDSRDLREGTSQDCNHNGFVDERDTGVPHFRQAVEHLNGVELFQNNVWEAEPIDFNLDGRMDLVVTSMFSTNVGAVSFWRNEGGPGLVHLRRLKFNNTRPYAIRSADLNADGLTDFVTSDASYNRVYVFLATGRGSFADPVTLKGKPSSNGSVGLEVEDLDGDGDIDVVFSSWGLDSVNVVLNKGDGAFGPSASYAVEFQPRGIAIGDVTGDGVPDLAVANEYYASGDPLDEGTVSVLRNDGSGVFLPHVTIVMPPGIPPYPGFARPQAVALGDVDRDGDLDLVTSSKYSNLLTIHHNDGAGAFTLAQVFKGMAIGSDVHGVIVSDLDGDGWEDIAWGDRDTHMTSIYRNSLGVFELHQDFASGNHGALSLAVADFSGDGKPDLVTTNDYDRTFSILVNKGKLDFEAAIHLRPDHNPAHAVMVDWTKDGKTDLATTNLVGTSVIFSVYPGLGDAVFDEAPIETPVSIDGILHARDIDHDGNLDLMIVNGPVIVLMGNGDGTFGLETSSNQWIGLLHVLADFDLDGELDIAWLVGGHPSLLRVSFGDGAGNFSPYTEYTDVREDESIAVGDINGDGAPEIFTGHRLGVFSIHPNNGDGTFGVRRDIILQGTPVGPKIDAIAVADFDLDNDNDVVISTVGLQMFYNPGGGNLPNLPVPVAEASASTLTVADIDLDGVPDLYGRKGGGNVYLNSGHGFFEVTMFLKRYDSNTRSMIVTDANNDGRLDVLIRPENSWSRYLYLNLRPVTVDDNANGIPDECEPGQMPRR